jgi:hypothetical protein
MNCSSARNRVLAATNPATIPESLRGHFDQCPACRAWQAKVIDIERVVVAMPVPPASGKAKRDLLAQFASTAVAQKKAKPPRTTPAPTPLAKPAPTREPLGERLARMWPAGLVAAAILVGAIAWAVLSGDGSKDQPMAKAPADPMLEKVVAAKVKLDTAPNNSARIDVLAGLAMNLHEEAGALSKVTPGDEMTSLATMYRQVVQEALVPHARALSEDERKATLPKYREQLEKAEQEANRLAAEAPVGSDRPLKEIAEVAKAGRIELAKLIQGRGA